MYQLPPPMGLLGLLGLTTLPPPHGLLGLSELPAPPQPPPPQPPMPQGLPEFIDGFRGLAAGFQLPGEGVMGTTAEPQGLRGVGMAVLGMPPGRPMEAHVPSYVHLPPMQAAPGGWGPVHCVEL